MFSLDYLSPCVENRTPSSPVYEAQLLHLNTYMEQDGQEENAKAGWQSSSTDFRELLECGT